MMNPSSDPIPKASADGSPRSTVSAFHIDPQALDHESRAEFRLRTFMDASPFGIIEYELRPEDRLIFVSANAAADRILNISCAALLGMKFEDAFPNVLTTDLPRTFRHVARTGEPIEMEQLTYKDERIAGIYEMYLFQTAPRRMAVMFRDVTAQRQDAEQLRASEEKLRLLAEHTDDLITLFDEKEVRLYVSPSYERITGWTFEDLQGQDWHQRVHPEDHALIEESDKANLLGRTTRVEYRYFRKDGSMMWLDTLCTPIPDAQGKITRFVARSIDITHRKRSEEELRASEQRYKHLAEQNRRLLQEVNHRVKNNLASVLGLVSLSAAKATDIATCSAALKLRVLSMARAHDLLSQREWRDLEMNHLARTILESIRQSMPSSGRLSIDGPSFQIPPRFATPLALVLQELMTNSTKHGAMSTPAGQVRLEWSIESDHWKLQWIESDGPPCSPPARVGVGLQLIEGLARHDLGGSIEFNFPTQGAICLLTLPLPEAEPEA